MAVSTGENFTAVKDGNALVAPFGGADGPWPFTSEMALRAGKLDGVFDGLPLFAVRALTVIQDNLVEFNFDIDGGDSLIVASPLPSKI